MEDLNNAPGCAMARYHDCELFDLTIVPLGSGALLRLIVAEEGEDKETIEIYCDDKRLKRLITTLRTLTAAQRRELIGKLLKAGSE